ncbi:MAG: flagellar biosynthetic protein FliO [Spirochaetia bacterium]|nr:flagellar biosynthetic protein FliO [Spirochaetia bacterium]
MRHNPYTGTFWIFLFFTVLVLQAASGSLFAQAPGYKEIGDSWLEKIHGKPVPEDQNSETTKESGSVSESEKNKATAEIPEVDQFSQTTPPEDAPSFTGTLLRFIFMMGIMIAVLYVILRYLKSKSGGLAFGGGGPVEVISSTPLMQGKSLQIIDIAGRLYAVGISDHGVNLITSIDDARSADKIRLYQSQKKETVPVNLLSELTSMIKKTDYRFWHGEGKEKPEADFQAVLQKEALTHTGDSNPDSEAGKSMDESESELSMLLSRQRRKIADLKSRKTEL